MYVPSYSELTIRHFAWIHLKDMTMHRHRLYLRNIPPLRWPIALGNTSHRQLGPPPWRTRLSHHCVQAHPEQAGRAEAPSDVGGQTMHQRNLLAALATSLNDTGLRIPHAGVRHRAQIIGRIFAAMTLALSPLSSRRRSPGRPC